MYIKLYGGINMKKLLIFLLCKQEGTYYDSFDDVLRPAYKVAGWKLLAWLILFIAIVVLVHLLEGASEALIALATIFIVSYTTAVYMANLKEIK